ncbi:MAG: M2 family metallopeptidase [Candidatus Eisenbacteria bacterium]
MLTSRLACAALAVALAFAAPVPAAAAPPVSPIQERADRFLALVNASWQALYTVENHAAWDAATDVSDAHDAASSAASKARAAFMGNPALITEARALLAHERELDALTVRQLRRALLLAAEGPMTNPALVAARIEAETQQASAMNGWRFQLGGKDVIANDLDERLVAATDLSERRAVWEASKAIGPALRPGLAKLQGLRNGVARELGYPDYFTLQAAGHDMTTAEVLAMQEQFLVTLRPLYEQLYTWARYELAKKYHQPVPERIPADWLPNRWGQEWQALVAVPGLDSTIAKKSPEWLVRTGERFYTSLGRRPLPESFWRDSDLYPVQPPSTRRKNAHASCWDMNLDGDIRSLMSVESDEMWFGTLHHELGHAYYDLAYMRPEVPYLLREGASPAFHEGFAGVAEVAARQVPYLQSLGLVPPGPRSKDAQVRSLLHDALATVPFMFFACGPMTHWEADVYAHALPQDQWNARWWQYVNDYQGIVPPAPRGEEWCDPATKTHINDTPAYYFSYAIATVFQYQVYCHIAKQVLHQDPRNCNFAGHPEVGAFLERMQAPGATQDWRVILRDATGEELSTRAMLDYYQPLMDWLVKQNRGRKIGWR